MGVEETNKNPFIIPMMLVKGNKLLGPVRKSDLHKQEQGRKNGLCE